MKIIVFRSEADRRRYCDAKLTSLFADTSSIQRFERATTRMMWGSIASTLAIFALWCFVQAAHASTSADCFAEAVRFERAVKVARAGGTTDQISAPLRGSSIFDSRPGNITLWAIQIEGMAPGLVGGTAWYWAHGLCTAIASDTIVVGARLRAEKQR